MENKTSRISYIDIARGFAIIFIVLAHALGYSKHCRGLYEFLYSFHVVLFFMISGYIFKIKENEKFLYFIKNKFLRIMVPYFVWALLFLVVYMFLGQGVGETLNKSSSFDIKTQIINVLYGNGNNAALKQNSALWFLPALFTMEIIYYFIIKLVNKRNKLKIPLIISLVIIGYITNTFLKVYLPWGINTSLNIGMFFLIGYLCKEHELFTKQKLFKVYYIIPILIIGVLAACFNKKVSYMSYDYSNFTLALLSGLCLSIITFYVSYLISKNKLLEYIGRNTMGILIFHKIILVLFQSKLGIISNLLKNSNVFVELALSFCITIIAIICSLLANKVIKMTLPILIGEKRVKLKES